MEQTLKITNVLADPTRFSIYNYIVNQNREVTVQEIADEFSIHPNVARLHLSKLEDVGMLKSENKKTGRGGRPSRIYRLSHEVIEFSFPARDWRFLAKIAIDSLNSLGNDGKKVFFETGHRYGFEQMEQHLSKHSIPKEELTLDQKMEILSEAASALGYQPNIRVPEDGKNFYLEVFNCPFQEIAIEHADLICRMHSEFIRGMMEALFDRMELSMIQTVFQGCDSCAYHVKVATEN